MVTRRLTSWFNPMLYEIVEKEQRPDVAVWNNPAEVYDLKDVWTTVDGSAVACTRCHAIPPGTGRHSLHKSKGYGCDECHSTVTNAGGTAIVTAALHVNGIKDVVLKRGGTWTASTRSCKPTCHGTETW